MGEGELAHDPSCFLWPIPLNNLFGGHLAGVARFACSIGYCAATVR
jgi:hypothetical protein